MKKIIALALALIMALSMASVAFAAVTYAEEIANNFTLVDANGNAVKGTFASSAAFIAPGETIKLTIGLDGYKIKGFDFTTGKLDGASLIESVKIAKDKSGIEIKVKESYTMALEADKVVAGVITVADKAKVNPDEKYYVTFEVNNDTSIELDGARKVSLLGAANVINPVPNAVQTMDEEGGYVEFTLGELTGVAKMAKNEKVYFNATEGIPAADVDNIDALEAVLGEDYEGIVETYWFETKAFEDVAYTYAAWAEDPHFFYAFDGEKLTAIDAEFDADEDVNAYVFTADAANMIVVTDTEVVLAAEEETKNPDTGANDVVGVAAALAVVSLVAAGAVSLKK